MAVNKIYCTFCSASQEEVKRLIVGPRIGDMTAAICNECVDLCVEINNDLNAKETTAVMATANYQCGSLGEEVDHVA